MNDSIYRDGTYLEKNPTWHEEDSPWKAKQIVDIIRRNGLLPATLAEVGCGGGLILKEVAAQFPDVRAFGYEISPQAFARCETRATAMLRFFLKDLLQTQDHYDVVIAADVFEHVDDYIGFLRGLRTHAAWAIFHIPLDISVQAIARGTPLINARESVGHLHYFTKETALATLEYAGYRIKDHVFTHGAVEAPGRGRSARIAALPRRLALAINEELAVRFLGGCSLLVLCETAT